MTIQLLIDQRAVVHVGDIVRYARYDWQTRGRFYHKRGTVTEIHEYGPGNGVLGVHFPHYAKGTNLIAHTDHFLLAKPEEKR